MDKNIIASLISFKTWLLKISMLCCFKSLFMEILRINIREYIVQITKTRWKREYINWNFTEKFPKDAIGAEAVVNCQSRMSVTLFLQSAVGCLQNNVPTESVAERE